MTLSNQAEVIDSALGHLVKGVFLFSLRDAEGRAVTPGTALINFGREPKTLLWSLETGSSLYPRLQPGTAVAVNVLNATQSELLQHAASVRGEERFAKGDWQQTEGRAPWLAGAEAVLQCRVEDVWQYSGQAAVVLVIEQAYASEALNPMCYAGGRFGGWKDS